MTASLSQTEKMPNTSVTAECPCCGLQVSDTNGVDLGAEGLLETWMVIQSIRVTKEPTVYMFPQSWCIKCRSKRRFRHE